MSGNIGMPNIVYVENGHFMTCNKCGKIVGIIDTDFEKIPFKCLNCCERSSCPTIDTSTGKVKP